MDFDIQDDLNIDPESYPDRDTGPKPPLPGNYKFKVTKWGYRQNKAGELVLYRDAQGNPKYPVLGVTTVEIVDPSDDSRKVVVFQDVASNPFQREGKPASAAADFLRAFDDSLACANTGEVLKHLEERLNGQMEFTARIDYKAYDKAYADATIAAAGGKTALSKKELNDIYRKASVQGYGQIQKDNQARGKANLPITQWVGPSGNVVKVNPVLSVFYPSSQPVNLGPDAKLRK